MTRASDTARLLGAGATINDGTTITTDDNTDQLTLISTDADANRGPRLALTRNSGSPADNDIAGTIKFNAKNDASEDIELFEINTTIIDASDGTEDAKMTINGIIGGASTNRLNLTNSEAIFNDDAVDIDFRVKSDSGNTEHNNALKLVASNGQIFSTAVYNWTTSASANVVVTSSARHLARSTPALKYKKEVRDLEEIDIDSFRPVRYKSRSDIDNQDKDNFGFIADEVHDAGITELVTYNGDVVEGFQYERLTAVLVKTLQEQKKTIKALTARITALENA